MAGPIIKMAAMNATGKEHPVEVAFFNGDKFVARRASTLVPKTSRKGQIDRIKGEVRHHCAQMAPLAVQMREFNPSLADELEKLLGKLDAWRRK